VRAALPLLLVAGVALPLWLFEAWLGRRAAAAATAAAAAAAALAVAAGAGVLWPLAGALLLVAAAYGFGARLAAWLGFDDDAGRWRGAPFRLAFGWAATAAIGLAAGTAGLLTARVVGVAVLIGVMLAALTVVGAAGRSGAPQHAPPLRTSATRDDAGLAPAWWWGLVVLFLAVFVGAAAPEVRHDALAAHLPIAREFAARHAIVDIRENAASYFQLNADVLYAMAMLVVPGAETPRLLHFGAGVAAALLVYDLGARLWGPPAGLTAAAVLAGTPLVWWLGGTAYTDLWVMLFALGAVAAVEAYRRRPRAGRAAGAGLLAGAAVGTKMTAAVLVAPLMGVLLLWIATSESGRARWRSIVALAAGLAATGLYSYLRTYLLLGNPFHPVLGAVFGRPQPGPLLSQTFGMGQGLQDLLALPWRVTVHPERFIEVGPVGAVYLLLLPAALLAVVRRQVPGWLVVTFAAAGLIWFLTAQYLRFFLPALPLAALMGAAGVFALPGRIRTVAGTVLGLAVAIVAGSWTAQSGWYFSFEVAVRRLERDEYVAIYVPGYRVARFAARALPADARVFGAGEEFSYHYERLFVPDSWRGWRYDSPRDLRGRTGSEVQAELRRGGFTHLVVVHAAPRFGRTSAGSWIAREAFWEDGPRLLHADGDRYLFEVGSPLGPRVPGSPLAESRHGTMGATAPVAPGAPYGLEAEIRSEGPDAAAVLGIEWLDRAGRPLAAAPRRRLDAGPEWRRVAMAAAAPDGAAAARVAVEAAGANAVDIRRAKFYELR
jgi:hypothetical protein